MYSKDLQYLFDTDNMRQTKLATMASFASACLEPALTSVDLATSYSMRIADVRLPSAVPRTNVHYHHAAVLCSRVLADTKVLCRSKMNRDRSLQSKNTGRNFLCVAGYHHFSSQCRHQNKQA